MAGRVGCFLPQSFNLIFPRRESAGIAEPMCNYHDDDNGIYVYDAGVSGSMAGKK